MRSSPGTPVFRFHRLRFADDAPMALEYATIVADCLPSLEAVETSLYQALERAGNRPVRALQRLRAVLLTREQAELLRAQARATRACWSSARVPAGTAARSSSRSPITAATPTTSSPSSARRDIWTPACSGKRPMPRRRFARQLQMNRSVLEQLGSALRQLAPRAVVTCARGSSDHAATFARYLVETRTGLLASSASPSVSSLYETQANLEGVLFIAISQSGSSPDLLAAVAAARKAGALVVALVNAEDSPLARAAHHVDPAARWHRNQRRGDEVLHRLARRDRASRRELDAGQRSASGAGTGARPAANARGSSTGARAVEHLRHGQ